MNDNLKNLKFEPDKEVWLKVNKTIRRHMWLRRLGWTSAVVAVAGVMAIAFWPKETVTESTPMVATAPEAAIVEEVIATPQAETPSDISIEATSKKITTPSQVLTIEEQPIVVDEPEIEATSEVTIIDNDPETALGIIGGADGPTAIYVTETPKQEAAQSQSQTIVADIPPAETPIAEEPQLTQPKASDPTAPEESILWIPNIFSPNSDEEALRTFRIKANDMVTEYHIYIYDRSGRMVYKSDDIYSYWDGTKGGMILPQAAYVYVIKYRDRDGKPFTQKGTVTLVR